MSKTLALARLSRSAAGHRTSKVTFGAVKITPRCYSQNKGVSRPGVLLPKGYKTCRNLISALNRFIDPLLEAMPLSFTRVAIQQKTRKQEQVCFGHKDCGPAAEVILNAPAAVDSGHFRLSTSKP